jgi:hypothetical protein
MFGMPVLQQWQPYSLKSRLRWKALLAAYSCGVLGHVPGVQSVGVSQGVLTSPVTESAEKAEGCTPVVYLGTPGPTRKAVVSLVSPERQVVSVMKVPLERGAATSILREAGALSFLGCRPGVAPLLLSCDTERSITAQEFCSGGRSGTDFQMCYWEWLSGLQVSGKTTSLADHCAAAQDRLSGHELGGFSDVVSRTGEFLKNPTSIGAFLVHGDFAPWNLKLRTDGTISRAIDWEEFGASGLPLHDYFHFHYIQDFLFNRQTDLGNLERTARPYMSHFGISHELFRKLAAAYLLSSFAARIVSSEHYHAEFYGNKLGQVLEGTACTRKSLVS